MAGVMCSTGRRLRLAVVAVTVLFSDAARLRSASSPATKLRATQYYGSIRVGKPTQEFRVIFDTGSGELILPGAKCDDAPCTSHRRFAAANSTTVVQIGWADEPTKAIESDDDRDTKSVALMGADVSGEFMRDTICVGDGTKVCGVADFIALTEESDVPFGDLEFDGVLGLSPTTTDAKEFSIPQMVLEAGHGGAGAQESLFAVHLAAHEGEIAFGGFHRELLAADPHWAPVSQNGTWQVLVRDITVDGKPANLCGKTGCQAAVDTGASLVTAPGNIVGSLVSQLDLKNDCSGKIPSIGFLLESGHHMELRSEDYIEKSSGACEVSLAAHPAGGADIVLGLPFLRRHHAVFDLGKSRVGFALAAEGAKLASDSKIPTVHLIGTRA